MSYPHDYYDIHGEPRLHNVGEGRPYLENDYHANDHGAQLPSLSTIGRGPRGEGLKVGNVVNSNGTVSFALYSDLTGELVWQSPNLDPGTLDFQVTDFRQLSAGQPAPLDIVYSRGGVTKTTTAYLPCGDRGSLVFLSDVTYTRNASDTYQTDVQELTIYGHRDMYTNRPIPRVNDIVFFRWEKDDEVGIGFGTIESVGTSSETSITGTSPVVFTAHTFVPCVMNVTKYEGGGGDPLIVELTKTYEDGKDKYTFAKTAREVYEAFMDGREVRLHFFHDDGADLYWLVTFVEPMGNYAEGEEWISDVENIFFGFDDPDSCAGATTTETVGIDEYPYFINGSAGPLFISLVHSVVHVDETPYDLYTFNNVTSKEVYSAFEEGRKVVLHYYDPDEQIRQWFDIIYAYLDPDGFYQFGFVDFINWFGLDTNVRTYYTPSYENPYFIGGFPVA